MFKTFFKWKKALGLRPYRAFVEQVNQLEASTASLSDEGLQDRFANFRIQLQAGEPLEQYLPSIFATVREGARRRLRLRPYDVQVMGGLALCQHAIAQMGTGEGKTITAAFVVLVQYLQGQPVHVCTANDYLADRDANALFPLYAFFGLSVGIVRQGQPLEEKRLVYGCDVTYGTHQGFAQDYLADHLVRHPNEMVQVKGRGFVLVDEADSVLIDEARVPVVVTTEQPSDSALYALFSRWAEELTRAPEASQPGDFWIDAKDRQAVLSDEGYERVNAWLVEEGLLSPDADQHYRPEHQQLLHRITAALSARHLLHRDQHYVVVDGAIVLVDELTGRLLPGRRWDAGLQQALEAKEGLSISPESIVLGRITLPHYFKLYQGLCGMTGTAATEAEELREVYGLAVVEIPPNKPCVRIDERDRVFPTQAAKMAAVVDDVVARHAKGQPVLIGTASIEQSEQLSALLQEKGLAHEVLNARQHAREAAIIEDAGRLGAITVSTNMAGRGVDILLGGSPDAELRRRWEAMGEEAWDALTIQEQKAMVDEIRAACAAEAEKVRAAGGLHIIGMERYESRRMDQQLRGRAGRQGDPGSSCFYLSFEDPLIENFAGERLRGLLAQLDIQSGDLLESALVHKAINSAQRQVEGRSSTVRQQLMKYDEVFSEQRRVYYAQRDELLASEHFHDWLVQLRDREVASLCERYAGEDDLPEAWNLEGLSEALARYGVELEPEASHREFEASELRDLIQQLMAQRHAQAAAQVPAENLDHVERYIVLGVMDHYWIAHLEELAQLRKGIHLRGHAKEDPQQAYKKEAFRLFEQMLETSRIELLARALNWRMARPTDEPQFAQEPQAMPEPQPA